MYVARHLLPVALIISSITAIGQSPIRAQSYTNPVINQNFPDPFVLNAGNDSYYAYATNGGGNMPCASSGDLIHWTMLGDALPTLPSWASGGLTWAPVVHKFGSTYVAYFAAQNPSTGFHSIGVATSNSPSGPFSPASTPPTTAISTRASSSTITALLTCSGKTMATRRAKPATCGFSS